MAPSKNSSRKVKAAPKAPSATPRVLRPRAVPAPASPSPAPDLSSGPLSASQSVESSSSKSFKTPCRSTIAAKTTDVAKISNSARVLRPRATPATASPSSAASQSSSPSATSPSTGPSSAESLKTRSRSATTVETPSKAVETEPSTTTRVLRSRATLASSSKLPVPVSDGRPSTRRTKRARIASPSPVLSPVLDRHGKRPRVDSGSEFEDEEEEEEQEEEAEDDDDDDDNDDLDEVEHPEDLQDAIVDADGLVRVGPQPMKPQQFIRSSPHDRVRRKFKKGLRICHQTTDRHLPGWSSGILEQERRYR